MDSRIEAYGILITEYAKQNYSACFREPDGLLQHKFIVPGSCYANELWDWDSWLTNLALRKIADSHAIGEYEKGCVLNFLDHVDGEGRMPIFIKPHKTALTAFAQLCSCQKFHVHQTVQIDRRRAFGRSIKCTRVCSVGGIASYILPVTVLL